MIQTNLKNLVQHARPFLSLHSSVLALCARLSAKGRVAGSVLPSNRSARNRAILVKQASLPKRAWRRTGCTFLNCNTFIENMLIINAPSVSSGYIQVFSARVTVKFA